MNARVARRVLAGGLWLDMVKPGWQNLIDWDRLDITNNTACVAGQALRDEAERESDAGGFRWLTGYDMLRELYGLSPDERAALGFSTDDLDDAGENDPWRELRNAWLDLWAPADLR